MISVKIFLTNDYDVNEFVNYCAKYKEDVDVCCGRYIIDAKSTLGVLSLLRQPITAVLHSEDLRLCNNFEYEIGERFGQL